MKALIAVVSPSQANTAKAINLEMIEKSSNNPFLSVGKGRMITIL
jgi:hypothetical protein